MDISHELGRIMTRLGELEERMDALERTVQPKDRKRKRENTSVLDHLKGLSSAGFFDQPRACAGIFGELGRRGHTYKRPESLTRSLLEAVREGLLERNHGENGTWRYSKKVK